MTSLSTRSSSRSSSRFLRAACASGAAAFAVLVACGGSKTDDTVDRLPDGGLPVYEAGAPTGTCDAVEQQRAIEGFTHVAVCSYTPYLTKPPSSGNHYPIWAAYKTYTAPVPEGFWVHNLEHGAIVLSYNCPNGCDADLVAAQAMLDALPSDPVCTALGGTVKRRSVMTPDPNLDVPFAASAWGWTLRAKCFDTATFQSFALRHYEQGREDLCDDGEDPFGWARRRLRRRSIAGERPRCPRPEGNRTELCVARRSHVRHRVRSLGDARFFLRRPLYLARRM